MAINVGEKIKKYSYFNRWRQERIYGNRLEKIIKNFVPDLIISGNTPLEAQKKGIRAAKGINCVFIYWLQDFLGLAARWVLKERYGQFGNMIGTYYIYLEKRLLNESNFIISISEDFCSILTGYGISMDKMCTIHNWSPIEELPLGDKKNEWSRRYGIQNKIVMLYCGTLGHKQNARLIARLAMEMRGNSDVEVVVVAEGIGADWLRQKKEKEKLGNLLLIRQQPYNKLADVLASADILIATLELEAGIFSVPSKIMSYLCAGRALLLSAPIENLASRIIKESECGIIAHVDDENRFIEAAKLLIRDEAYRNSLGWNGRKYAERAFNIKKICDSFEGILMKQKSMKHLPLEGGQ